MDYRVSCNMVYDKAIKTEWAFLMMYLTYPYIYFAILFCQNKVKKICKYGVRVFSRNADMTAENTHWKHVSFLRFGYIG